MSEKPKPIFSTDRVFISQTRDELIRQEIAAERAKFDRKTAKLRALRLAKEAADQETQLATPPIAENIVSKTRKRSRREAS
jgi:hypothetical protein